VVTGENWIALKRHPSTPSETVRAICALVRRSASRELQMTFRLEGDIRHIHIPPPQAPRIGIELWRHTCFEAFIAIDGQAAYHEFNFSPSGEWTVYALRGYRDGGPLMNQMMRPGIAVRSDDHQFELDALVRLDRLSDIHPRASLRIGLSAVVEADGGLSYWALHHPAAKPDFHSADSFALLLDPPGSGRP
jgi:hypothetical protein